jgi:hypothetical protein
MPLGIPYLWQRDPGRTHDERMGISKRTVSVAGLIVGFIVIAAGVVGYLRSGTHTGRAPASMNDPQIRACVENIKSYHPGEHARFVSDESLIRVCEEQIRLNGGADMPKPAPQR